MPNFTFYLTLTIFSGLFSLAVKQHKMKTLGSMIHCHTV